MDKVLIFDDFFSNEILLKIKEIIRNGEWCRGENNNIVINNFYFPNNKFLLNNSDNPFWRMELISHHIFKVIMKNIIEKKLNKKFILRQVYAISQYYQQNGNFHIDCNTKNTYTFCFYINDFQNIEDINGNFYIKVPEEKHILSINPVNNRAIFFPSNYIHSGKSFSKDVSSMRVCIAWKFIEI